MLEQNAVYFGGRAGLLSDGNEPLSHQQLWDQVAMTVPALNRLGVGRGDRVVIVLPQGPELALAFLAVAAGATAAPLNPAYAEKEFLFYLEDLQARALILPLGSDSPARAAAGGCRARASYLGDDFPSEDGAAHAHEFARLRPAHRGDTATPTKGPMPQRDAVVSDSRSRRMCAGIAGRGWECVGK